MRTINLPVQLPATPEGFTKKLYMHLNFGNDGGGATYNIFFPDGHIAPFSYQYDTRKGGLTGFSLPNVDGVLTWQELVAKWPEWIKEQNSTEAA